MLVDFFFLLKIDNIVKQTNISMNGMQVNIYLVSKLEFKLKNIVLDIT